MLISFLASTKFNLQIPTFCSAGEALNDERNQKLEINIRPQPRGFATKVPVFSFNKFPNVDKNLGPEMKSTGEAIRYIVDLTDPYFRELESKRNMYLTR